MALLGDAPGLQIAPQAQHAEGDLRVDGVFRDAELRGDFAMGKPVDLAQRDHLAAAFGQGLDALGEQLKFLIMADGLGHTGPIFQDGQALDFYYGIDGDNLPVAEEIERGVAGRGEEKGFRGAQRAVLAGLQEAGIGFLDQIVDVGMLGKLPVQVGAQRAFVRLDLGGKPAGGLGILRRHR